MARSFFLGSDGCNGRRSSFLTQEGPPAYPSPPGARSGRSRYRDWKAGIALAFGHRMLTDATVRGRAGGRAVGWPDWQRKGVFIGLLWGIVAWIPYTSPYLQAFKLWWGLPAALGLALETLVYRYGGQSWQIINAPLLSVPVGAFLGFSLSLPVQWFWGKRANAAWRGKRLKAQTRRGRGMLSAGRLFF